MLTLFGHFRLCNRAIDLKIILSIYKNKYLYTYVETFLTWVSLWVRLIFKSVKMYLEKKKLHYMLCFVYIYIYTYIHEVVNSYYMYNDHSWMRAPKDMQISGTSQFLLELFIFSQYCGSDIELGMIIRLLQCIQGLITSLRGADIIYSLLKLLYLLPTQFILYFEMFWAYI